ncbi:MAG: glycoside hydrolase family 3 C-terminal domain-containing protein, partial [Clostridia bacterium]|nr:glycoside hydrolase family 3 C-terminal domain-containing protein [Clostridia bacterium]
QSMQSMGVGSCLKHFAVNSQETRRMTVNAVVDERALREIYLYAFEQAVKGAQPYCIMNAYNKLNGTSCAQNKRLLTDILRTEWGFDGLVMSDWGATYNVAEAIDAGMDLEMPDGGNYHEQLTIKYVNDGTLSMEALDRACQRVVNLVEKCNVPKPELAMDYDSAHNVCRQVENDCAVLLKNDNDILPLTQDESILVVGGLATTPRFQGAGSSHINAQAKTFLQVLEENNVQYHFAQGYNVLGDKAVDKLENQAIELAKTCKTVVFFGGLTDDFEGEGYDRTKLEIPTCQQQLLDKLYEVNPNIVFVAFGGSPFTMPWLNKTQALLHMYLGGEAVMESAFDLLFGKVSPSGRLAESYPLALQDTPCYNYFANDRFVDEHRESIFVGYRYYNTFDIPTLFPFGYGLSYSKFTYSNLSVTPCQKGFDVTVDVTNVGSVPASEVVQLYVDNCNCGYIRAKRELKAFAKILLQPNESKTVSFHLDERAFAIYHQTDFVAVNGTYGISICQNVNDMLLTEQVDVTFGKDLSGNDQQLYPDYFTKPQGAFTIDEGQFYALAGQQKQEYSIPKRGEFTLLNTFEDMPTVGIVKTIAKIGKMVAKSKAPSKTLQDPVAQMILTGMMQTPLISMMSVGGIPAKFIKFILHTANKQHGKAWNALFGKYTID